MPTTHECTVALNCYVLFCSVSPTSRRTSWKTLALILMTAVLLPSPMMTMLWIIFQAKDVEHAVLSGKCDENIIISISYVCTYVWSCDQHP